MLVFLSSKLKDHQFQSSTLMNQIVTVYLDLTNSRKVENLFIFIKQFIINNINSKFLKNDLQSSSMSKEQRSQLLSRKFPSLVSLRGICKIKLLF